MSRATTPLGQAVRAVMAAAILGSALLLGGCIVAPGYGYGYHPYWHPFWHPGWHYWR